MQINKKRLTIFLAISIFAIAMTVTTYSGCAENKRLRLVNSHLELSVDSLSNVAYNQSVSIKQDRDRIASDSITLYGYRNCVMQVQGETEKILQIIKAVKQ